MVYTELASCKTSRMFSGLGLCDPLVRTPFLWRTLKYVRGDKLAGRKRSSHVLFLKVNAQAIPSAGVLRIYLIARSDSKLNANCDIALAVRDIVCEKSQTRNDDSAEFSQPEDSSFQAINLDFARCLRDNTRLALLFEYYSGVNLQISSQKPCSVGLLSLCVVKDLVNERGGRHEVECDPPDDTYVTPAYGLRPKHFGSFWPASDQTFDSMLQATSPKASNDSISAGIHQLCLEHGSSSGVFLPENKNDRHEVREIDIQTEGQWSHEPLKKSPRGPHTLRVLVQTRTAPLKPKRFSQCTSAVRFVHLYSEFGKSCDIAIRFDYVCPMCLRNCHRNSSLRMHLCVDHDSYNWSCHVSKLPCPSKSTCDSVKSSFIVRRFHMEQWDSSLSAFPTPPENGEKSSPIPNLCSDRARCGPESEHELLSCEDEDDRAVLRRCHVRSAKMCRPPPLLPRPSSRDKSIEALRLREVLQTQRLYHIGTVAPFEARHLADNNSDSEAEVDNAWRLRLAEEEVSSLPVNAKKKVLWSLWNRFAFQGYCSGEYGDRYTRYSVELFALQYRDEIHRLGLEVDLMSFLRCLSVHGCIDATAIRSVLKCLSGQKRVQDCEESKHPRGLYCDDVPVVPARTKSRNTARPKRRLKRRLQK